VEPDRKAVNEFVGSAGEHEKGKIGDDVGDGGIQDRGSDLGRTQPGGNDARVPFGQHARELTSLGRPVTGTPRWSPDGRWIAFDSVALSNPNIHVIGAERGTPRRLTSGPFGNFMPSWSPDGKRIYFKSDRSGTDQIWWIPAGGGSATQLTHGGAFEAFASPDGKLVYYTIRAWGPLWSVPADGGPEKSVSELERFDRIYRSWGVVGQGIYFIFEGPEPAPDRPLLQLCDAAGHSAAEPGGRAHMEFP